MDMKRRQQRVAITDFRTIRRSSKIAMKLAWESNRRWLITILLLNVITIVTTATQILVAKEIVNYIVDSVSSQDNDWGLIFLWLGVGIGVLLIQSVVDAVTSYGSRRLTEAIRLTVNLQILTHATTLDIARFEDPNFQDSLDRVNQSTSQSISAFISGLILLVTRLLELATIIIILALVEPLPVLAFGVVSFFSLRFLWWYTRASYLLDFNRATRRRWAGYFGSLMLGRGSVPEIKLLQLENHLMTTNQSILTQFAEEDRKLHLQATLGSLFFKTLSIIVSYVGLVWVTWRALNGELQVGDVALFLTAFTRLRSMTDIVTTGIQSVLGNALYVGELQRFKQEKPVMNLKEGDTLESVQGDIRFENVTFAYGNTNQPVLKDISFHIKPGEVVALVGENGSGKTTLVKLMARLYDPSEGRILLDDKDLKSYSAESIYPFMGFVLQSFNRYEATARDNIGYGNWKRYETDPEGVEAISKLANTDDLIKNLPEGYNTLLGRMFGDIELSGGQWQRMAIARAFARSEGILILDEPTANVDARTEYELFKQFQTLAQKRTAIIISHRFSTVSIADRIIVLHEGRIVEEGNHAQLLEKNGLYAELYHMQRGDLDES